MTSFLNLRVTTSERGLWAFHVANSIFHEYYFYQRVIKNDIWRHSRRADIRRFGPNINHGQFYRLLIQPLVAYQNVYPHCKVTCNFVYRYNVEVDSTLY